jgi:hypothetical protein
MNNIQQRLKGEQKARSFGLFASGLALLLGFGLVLIAAIHIIIKIILAAMLFLLLRFTRACFDTIARRNTEIIYLTQLLHIVEASKSPKDDRVYNRAEEHRTKLKKLGNPYGVKVFEVIFREGEYALESWDEFQIRKSSTEDEIIKERHRVLRNRNRKDYLEQLGNQVI